MDRDALIEEAARKYRNAETEYRMHCAMNTPSDPVEADAVRIRFYAAKRKYLDAQAEFHRLWGF